MKVYVHEDNCGNWIVSDGETEVFLQESFMVQHEFKELLSSEQLDSLFKGYDIEVAISEEHWCALKGDDY